MQYSLLPYKFKKIGYIIILFSITFMLLKLFFNFELSLLKKVPIYSFLPTNFKSEGATFRLIANLNNSVYTTLLLLGLLFITICKQKIENDTTIKTRLESFVLTTKIYVIINILALYFVWGFWNFYMPIILQWTFLILYNILFYFKISNKIK